MAKLSGNAIFKAIKNGSVVIDPFDHNNLGPNSYDLTLGSTIKTYQQIPDYHSGTCPLDFKNHNKTDEISIPDEGIVLEPRKLYLAHTNETAGSTKYVPCIEGRSSLARLGVQVHLTAGFGDVGFVGQWTLEIAVVHPVRLYKNIKVCQIYFDTLEGDVTILYNGKYNGSKGVIESMSFKDFPNA